MITRRSASWTVLKRCAIMTVVRPTRALSSACCTTLSLALVASSSYFLPTGPVVQPQSASRSAAVCMKDFPKPSQLSNTDPYREAGALSQKLQSGAWQGGSKRCRRSSR